MLLEFSIKSPDAGEPLKRWWTICKKNKFSLFAEMKNTFGTTDIIGKCVVFNIGGGKYRLVSRVNFLAHRMWLKYILPHKKYEKLSLKDDEKCQP